MQPPYSALTIILLGLTAVAAFNAASSWLHLGRYRERPSERPEIPIHAFRSAGIATALALGMLGLALLWVAALALAVVDLT